MSESDDITLRALRGADLDRLVELDRAHSGQSRRGFFAKRLAAMERHPALFLGLAAERDGRLAGFAAGRMLDGEFGTAGPLAALDALAVEAASLHHGLGRRLVEAIAAQARERGAGELRTQIDWRQAALAGFFSEAGFELAPEVVLERATAGGDF